MLEHHVQKAILTRLVECDTARFADLRPKNLDSNLFTYHLNALIAQGLAEKTADGKYRLTNTGKLAGINVGLHKNDLLEQAHTILLLALRDDDDNWLLRRRLVQPAFHKVGFVHGEPRASETILEAASRIMLTRTGLTTVFSVRGSGFIKLQVADKLESYSHFVLLEANQTTGSLRASDSHGENFWIKAPDFNDASMIPSMNRLAELLRTSTEQFFAELTYAL